MRGSSTFSVVLSALAALTLGGAAYAAIITVCSSGCDYTSIQDAVDNASPGDVLDLAAETFVENVVVDRDLTIQGAGRGETIIDGNASGSVVVNEADLVLRDLTIQNGLAEMGGGVKNLDGQLLLTGCEVRDNTATVNGGGVHNVSGEVVITTNLIEGNSSSLWGGGISNSYGEFTTELTEGTLIVTDSVIRNNVALQGGGGVANCVGSYACGGYPGPPPDVTTVIDTTIITGNTAPVGGGVASAAELTVTQSTVSDNGYMDEGSTGGGLSIRQGPAAITTTTISGNIAGWPGGVATAYRDWIVGGPVKILNSTIAANIGLRLTYYPSPPYIPLAGGLAGHIELENSIVANNVGGNCQLPGVAMSPASAGHNLSSDDTCAFGQPGDFIDTDPLLLPLADNGGPTPTCALHPDSPAIDAGGDSCELTDQRGVSRPQDGDGDGTAACDIGAIEYVPPRMMLDDLVEHVRVLELHKGTEKSLLAKLKTAMLVLTDVVPGNDRASVNVLRAFIHHAKAQRGKKITEEQADELIAEAQRIIDLLNFGGSDSDPWSQS